ncbi:glutathione synthetase [Crenothrix sp. D3]|nr:glutathione synthetase [Crenothrix sp. D3]
MIITPEIIDIIGYISASLTTASFLPQVIHTLKTRNTKSLSLSMYTLFTLGVLGWLIYGIFIGNKVIVIANSITLLLATSILVFKIYNVLTHKE